MDLGVFGTGNMGQNHVRLYSGMKNIDSVRVFDINTAAARTVAEKNGAIASDSPEDLLSKVDAVSICVPTPYHLDIAKKAIEHEVHMLIEKPICQTVYEARESEQASVAGPHRRGRAYRTVQSDRAGDQEDHAEAPLHRCPPAQPDLVTDHRNLCRGGPDDPRRGRDAASLRELRLQDRERRNARTSALRCSPSETCRSHSRPAGSPRRRSGRSTSRRRIGRSRATS